LAGTVPCTLSWRILYPSRPRNLKNTRTNCNCEDQSGLVLYHIHCRGAYYTCLGPKTWETQEQTVNCEDQPGLVLYHIHCRGASYTRLVPRTWKTQDQTVTVRTSMGWYCTMYTAVAPHIPVSSPEPGNTRTNC